MKRGKRIVKITGLFLVAVVSVVLFVGCAVDKREETGTSEENGMIEILKDTAFE